MLVPLSLAPMGSNSIIEYQMCLYAASCLALVRP